MSSIKELLNNVYTDLVNRKPYNAVPYNFGINTALQAAKIDNMAKNSPEEGKYYITIARTSETSENIKGILTVSKDGQTVFSCDTLEMPWADNQANASCIPNGYYSIRYADKTTKVAYPHLVFEGTSPRSGVAIKKGVASGKPEANSITIGKAHKRVNDEEYIWQRIYQELGNYVGTAGLMGNLRAESYNLTSNNLEGKYEKKFGMTDESYTQGVDEGTYTNFINDKAGYGLAQWTYHTRKQELLDLVKERGVSISDLDTQLDFLFIELKRYTNLWNFLKTTTSIKEATERVMTEFERPADQSQAKKDQRTSYAQGFFDEFVLSNLMGVLYPKDASGEVTNKEVVYLVNIYDTYSEGQQIPIQQQIVSNNLKNLPTTISEESTAEATADQLELTKGAVLARLPETSKTPKAEKAIIEEEKVWRTASLPSAINSGIAYNTIVTDAVKIPQETAKLDYAPQSLPVPLMTGNISKIEKAPDFKALEPSISTASIEAIVEAKTTPTTTTSTTKKKQQSITSQLTKITASGEKLVSKIKSLGKTQPEEILYDKTISFANTIFLSKDPNEYVAAIMGESQLYIRDKLDSLQRDMANLTSYISEYISWMMDMVELLVAKHTFPNLTRILADMCKHEEELIAKVASLQGRLIKEWDYAEGRLNDIDKEIYYVLDQNYKVSSALAFYDPDATLNVDLKSFIKYIKKEAERILKAVTNLKDFPKSFAANMDPKKIFYKNFSRIYTYLTKVYKATSNSAYNWRAKNINTLRNNCETVDTNLYKVATIIEKYRHSNAMTRVYDEETGKWVEATTENSMLPGLEASCSKLRELDTSKLMAVIAEAEYLVASVLRQAEILIKTPYETLMAELETRRNPMWRPFQELSGLAKGDASGIRAQLMGALMGEKFPSWQLTKDLGAMLKGKFGDRLREASYALEDNVVIDFSNKLQGKIDVLNRLLEKNQILNETMGKEVTAIYEAVSGIQDIYDKVDTNIKEAVSQVKNFVPNMGDKIQMAAANEMMSLFDKVSNVTKSGETAGKLEKVTAQIQEEAQEGTASKSITYRVVDSLNRAIALFKGDHLKECTDKVLEMESNGGSSVLNYINDYRSNVYDNAAKWVDYVRQWVRDTDDSEETTETTSLTLKFKQDLLNAKS